MTRTRISIAWIFTMAAAGAAPVWAAQPTIVAVTSNLQPNQANQSLQFLISGTDQIAATELNFQINDGTFGPTTTGADILTGTIFGGNNSGQVNLNGGPLANRLALVSTFTIANSTVSDNGLLATLMVDTTLMNSGTFQINLLNAVIGNSTLVLPSGADLPLAYPNNQFSIGSIQRVWNKTTGDTWNLDSNWLPFAPYTIGDVAVFAATAGSLTPIITLDGDRSAGSLLFNSSSASYTLAQGTGGVLHLNNGASPASIQIVTGNHAISAPLGIPSAGVSLDVAPGDTLTLSGGITGTGGLTKVSGGTAILGGALNYSGATTISAGTLALASTPLPRQTPGVMFNTNSLSLTTGATFDSTNHDFMIGHSNLATVENQILNGFGVGPGGAQITSSTALADGNEIIIPFDAAANAITSWDGVSVTQPNTIIAKYTYSADANFDGKVDFNDYTVITANYGQTTPGLADFSASFLAGDLNLDGKVDFNDYTVVTGLYGAGTAAPLGALSPLSATAVPEPAALFLAGSPGLILLLRRRTRRTLPIAKR